MNSIGLRGFSCLICLLSLGLTIFARQGFAQIYQVKEMNTERQKGLE